MELKKARHTVLLAASAFCFFLLHLAPPSLAKDHIVGTDHGWQPPADAGPSVHLNYTVWAATQKFYLGDEVSFHYPEHMQYTVFQVNFSVYTNCTINIYSGHDWIYNWTNKHGKTVVPLNQTMVYYFVDANNCNNGMKVAINVTKNITSSSSTTTNTSTSTSTSHSQSSSNHSSQAPTLALTLSTLILAQALLFFCVGLLFPAL